MKKIDLRLLRSIKNAKGQFISITFLIMLALMVYVALSMVADNLYSSMFHYYHITNFGDIFIQVSRIPQSAVEKLTSIEGIELAQGRISEDVPLKVEDPNEKVNVRVVSLPKDEYRINDIYILDGEELGDNHRTTLVLQQFFDARKMELGDTITPYIGGVEYPLEVIGVVGSPEYIYLMENEQALLSAPEKFGVIYVTEEFAQAALGYKGAYNEIVIKVDEDHLYRIDSIVDELEDVLGKYGVKSIIKRENQLSHSVMMQEIESVEAMSNAIAFIFLLVAAIIINIMLSRIVKKDRTSIGLLKAMGYTNKDILLHYAKYSILMGIAGSVLGILCSIPASRFLVELYIEYMNIPLFGMNLNYLYFISGILLTAVFCIISGLVGARGVLKISPAESMKPEPPKSRKRIWLEKVTFVWNKISFSWKMVIRNIFRTKRRSLFLVIGIALTYAVTIVPIYLSSVFPLLFNEQFGELQTMDYNIDFLRPVNDNSALLEVSQLIDIDHIEPKIEIPLEVSRGWKKETVSVIAVPKDTKLYDFKNKSGREIDLPEDGIFLSTILAKSLDVKVGDVIEVKSYIGDKEKKEVEVKGIVEQHLGSNGYMNIDAMYDLIDERNMVTGVLINSDDEVVTKLKDVKNIRQVQSMEDMQNSMLKFMDMMIASVSVWMIFGGALGFAIVYNITTVSINERIMEFSSLRVLGFDKSQIYRLVSRENGLAAIFGILLGIPLGYGMCTGLTQAISTEIYSIPIMILPSVYVFSGIATIIFTTLAQLATIRKIHNINFMEALKNRVS